MFTTSIRRKGQ